MIIIDTSGLIAAMFEDQKYHEECAQILRDDPGPRFVSQFVLAEAAYLINKYGGVDAELAFLQELERGPYHIADFRMHWLGDTHRMVWRYRDLNIGLTDAATVMLAEYHECRNILTLDIRHFRAIKAPTLGHFRILPVDLHL